MKKIVTVIGARPQFIKAAPISEVLASKSSMSEVIVHTGQHFDARMSQLFFDEMQLRQPAYHLETGGLSHGAMTGRMLAEIEAILVKEEPAAVLVYGDTNSTIAGALAAVKLHIPVAHVEAGLRSYNRSMPEEVNRVLTDHMSDFLFCPGGNAAVNLAKEGVTDGVHVVGDVMYDALLKFKPLAAARSRIIEQLGLESVPYAVATIHRAESTDAPVALAQVVDWLEARGKEMVVVMPVHPRTRKRLDEYGLSLQHVRLIEPLGYLDMQRLTASAAQVFTDSGGLQKEAYFHRVPCVTLREETEWTETVDAGWNRLWRQEKFHPRREIASFGQGDAARKVVDILSAAL